MSEDLAPWFNLIDSAWLPALDHQGQQTDLSLVDAFRRAGELRELTGELPTQTFANLRLLLAILHRAVGTSRETGPRSEKEWGEIRSNWSSTVERVEQYLERFRDRFWLVHATEPFFQVAGLESTNGELKSPAEIIADGPGNSAYLTTRLGEGLSRITWAEAARWLVHVHAYDVSGIHSGAVGDPRVKGGKGYPIGTGWAGQIGGIHLVGDTLQETLMLNLVVAGRSGLETRQPDKPVWERPPLDARPEDWLESDAANHLYREPTGPVDLYTWQSRRVRLVGDEAYVTGVVNAQGDRATPQFRQRLEPLTSWRHSKPQTAKFKKPVYMPLELVPGRALWRGLESLLPHATERRTKDGQSERLVPAVVTWLRTLQLSGMLDDRLVGVRAIGATYESNQTAIGAVIDDKLSLSLSLLSESAAGLAQSAVDAVDQADKAVLHLGYLAQNVARAAGASPDAAEGPQERARERGFDALDGPFREWLRTLAVTADEVDARTRWQVQVQTVLSRLAGEVIADAGPGAVVGRMVGDQYMDAGLAEYRFRKKLREILPHSYPPQAVEQTKRVDDEEVMA
ncbi:type I-E CRISPR-associated protein Cse1/CasA [Oerskovia flava]|uniref:type I-E CRISPR-associated protein Cse1/CasA n=1 Tax=Oerskovia flava TaxID=2986422 RepID=UPI00223F0AB7|nr:type I-E CRISPR-associated protein Cse1/CasA [Oerskovia sp. JB1-3-2]